MAIDFDRNDMMSVPVVLRTDSRTPPETLFQTSPTEEEPEDLKPAEIPRERYFSKEFHDLEVEKLWGKVWQMACREEDIPNVGDYVVYDIALDSVIVIRTAPDEVHGYLNACQHRGTQLCQEPGNAQQLRCPFHGWTWGLDGTLVSIPCKWDFPHVDPEDYALPQVQVGTWGGFVFINFDLDAEPLDSFLENIPQDFAEAGWDLAARWKAVHVEKVIAANWKIAHEAFIESYHVIATHPQALAFTGDANTQYDIYGRHNRMITLFGVPSPHLGDDLDPAEAAEQMARELGYGDPDELGIDDGTPVRHKVADSMRAQFGGMTGADLSAVSDSEMLDAIQYFIFPNMYPWAGVGSPLVYRFRPNGDDPETSIMEVMLLLTIPPSENGERPPASPPHRLGIHDSWTEAPELMALGPVFDQDSSNLARIQRGIRVLRKPGVTLANYQESRIRHFHRVLDSYLRS